MSSPSAENARSRIEGNSSATRFGVVHCGSRGVEFEGSPAARCASSLANAATISLAVAAARAGHRKGVKATKAHRRYNRQTVQRARARAARQCLLNWLVIAGHSAFTRVFDALLPAHDTPPASDVASLHTRRISSSARG